jgi:hypothetical protein
MAGCYLVLNIKQRICVIKISRYSHTDTNALWIEFTDLAKRHEKKRRKLLHRAAKTV